MLDRDAHGEALRREARVDQRLVAAQLHRWLQSTPDEEDDSGQTMNELAVVLDRHVAAHINREAILTFPHVRHTTTPTQRRRLTERYARLRAALDARLTMTHALIWDGRWATATRAELAALLDIEEDLVVVVPDLEPTRPTGSSTRPVADRDETPGGSERLGIAVQELEQAAHHGRQHLGERVGCVPRRPPGPPPAVPSARRPRPCRRTPAVARPMPLEALVTTTTESRTRIRGSILGVTPFASYLCTEGEAGHRQRATTEGPTLDALGTVGAPVIGR